MKSIISFVFLCVLCSTVTGRANENVKPVVKDNMHSTVINSTDKIMKNVDVALPESNIECIAGADYYYTAADGTTQLAQFYVKADTCKEAGNIIDAYVALCFWFLGMDLVPAK